MTFDALILARVQFAFVMSFHILFPAFTIGLANWLALLEVLHLRTGKAVYLRLYQFWIKLFAVSFGLGVVSGIVMSYQFGTNWSRFSAATGNVLGPLMSYEVITAFFLEASFLGIMLFGRERVGPRLHLLATVLVAFGTLLSTFWIISANSWMQTPAGYELRDGVFFAKDWWAIVFNPSFPGRLVHMVFAAFLTTCFAIGAVSAWHLWTGKDPESGRVGLAMAVGFAAVVAPLQIAAGDYQGLKVREQQPAKLAAMEGHWESQAPASLVLFAWPDEARERNRLVVEIPVLGSIILTHSLTGGITGLKAFPPDQRPPMTIPFFAFRVMVAIGFVMLFMGLAGSWLWWKGRLAQTRWFLLLSMACGPLGFIAVLSGWYTAEVGRQPFVVYGLLRTADATSPVPGGSVALSLGAFVVVYLFVFGFGLYYMARLVRHGPQAPAADNPAPGKVPKRPLSLPDAPAEPAE